VRQVEAIYYLHDLSTFNVYKVKHNDTDSLENVVNGMTKTIYFFEPGEDNKRPPKYFAIPSLSTLSPNEDRIHEYVKHAAVKRLYFPVWSESEYWAVGLNEKLDKDDINERYYKYGGILCYLFRDKYILEEELGKCLTTDKLAQFLRAEVTDVGTDGRNRNASGYLVSYTDIPCDGDGAFESRTLTLTLTSLYVKQKIRENIFLKSEVESAKEVLNVLSGFRRDDFQGVFLESIFTTMIAGGQKTKWQACEVGTAEWKKHKRNKMTIERIPVVERDGVDNMEMSLHKKDLVLVPLNPLFPVVDIVESQPNEKEAVTAYKITWRKSHPFTMKALRALRETKLKIATSRLLKIFFVVPGNEETYAKRQKTAYLEDLKEDKEGQAKVLSADETEMWNKTSIYVVWPKEGWKPAIEHFFLQRRA
jgi:hypothetical protein